MKSVSVCFWHESLLPRRCPCVACLTHQRQLNKGRPGRSVPVCEVTGLGQPGAETGPVGPRCCPGIRGLPSSGLPVFTLLLGNQEAERETDPAGDRALLLEASACEPWWPSHHSLGSLCPASWGGEGLLPQATWRRRAQGPKSPGRGRGRCGGHGRLRGRGRRCGRGWRSGCAWCSWRG